MNLTVRKSVKLVIVYGCLIVLAACRHFREKEEAEITCPILPQLAYYPDSWPALAPPDSLKLSKEAYGSVWFSYSIMEGQLSENLGIKGFRLRDDSGNEILYSATDHNLTPSLPDGSLAIEEYPQAFQKYIPWLLDYSKSVIFSKNSIADSLATGSGSFIVKVAARN